MSCLAFVPKHFSLVSYMTKWYGIDSAENIITEAFETLHCVNITQHNKLIVEKAPKFKYGTVVEYLFM